MPSLPKKDLGLDLTGILKSLSPLEGRGRYEIVFIAFNLTDGSSRFMVDGWAGRDEKDDGYGRLDG